MTEAERGTYTYEWPRPAVTVDAVVLAPIDRRWHVLLIERGREPFTGTWALPGGFVDMDETLATSALRELEEETGMTGVVLEQLQTFGTPGRDPRGRTISVVYIGVTAADAHEVEGRDDAADARWYPLDDPPALAFDHDEVLAVARTWLAARYEGDV